MKVGLTFLFLAVATASCLGQVDSVVLRIKNTDGVERSKAYYDAIYFYLRGNPTKAKELIGEADYFAARENNTVITAYSILNHGLFYSALGKLDSAIFFLEQSKAIALNAGDKEILVKINSSLGKAYISKGNPEQGLKALYEALRGLSDSPHHETEIKVRINICWAYLELKRYQDCVNYGKQSLPIAGKSDEWMLPYFYNNMAVSYGALHKVDSARVLIDKSIKILEPNQQFAMLANAHFILGTIYADAKDYDRAAKEYLKAKPYREKLGDILFIVSDLYALSGLYYKMGEYQKGIEAGKEALRLAAENNLTLKFEGAYLALAQNSEGLKDFKNASKYYNLLAASKDSVYKHATSDAIAEMQEKYEAEKKDRQISDLNKDNEIKTATIERNTVLIGALIVVMVLSAFLFYLWRKRDIHLQEIVMQEQKSRMREAQISAVIDSQEKERTRFASDLHDGIGQLVSALQINVKSLKGNKNGFDHRDELFSNSEQLLTEIHQEIRNIAFNLMPPVLVKEGLLAAVNELIRKVNKSGNIKCTINAYDFDGRFAELAEISLYRIIQEFVSNIIKHSSASVVNISFTGYETEVILTIEDDGVGYDLERFKSSEGNGWRNIQSRLNLIKATIEFDVVESRKTNTITINIPKSSLAPSDGLPQAQNTKSSV